MKKATTFRLHEDVQAGLDLISRLQQRPKNKLVNEAVAEYVTRHAQQTGETLEQTLKRVKAYQKADANYEHAIEAFVDAEAAHGRQEDPMEGKQASLGGPVTETLRHLIDDA